MDNQDNGRENTSGITKQRWQKWQGLAPRWGNHLEAEQGVEGWRPLRPRVQQQVGLYSLNLACNKFTWSFKKPVGQMKSLESMGLSPNSLNGSIPQKLGTLNQLGYLDLSCNNLSGDIPIGGHFNTWYPVQDFQGEPFLYPLTACTQRNGCILSILSASAHGCALSMQVVDLECKLRRQATNPKPQASNATATPSLQLCIVLKKSPKKYMFGRLSTMKKCFSINNLPWILLGQLA